MATSFATSRRTRSRTTKSATATTTAAATATTTAIIQNVLEIGLATVLERRGAFPPEFFVHQALGGGEADDDSAMGTMAARFDEGWLRSRRGTNSSQLSASQTQRSAASQSQSQLSQSQSQSQTQSQATKDSGSSSHTDDDDDDTATTTTDCDAPLSTIGGYSAGKGATEGTDSRYVQSMVSQLLPPSEYYQSRTVQVGGSAGSMESGDEEEEGESQTVGDDGGSTTSDGNEIDDQDEKNEEGGTERRIEQMRAEALLLLEWIRRGVIEGCWRHNLLSRVIVGVCVPAAAGPANGDADGDGGGSGGPARLVESYAFDLSTAADEVEKMSQKSGTGTNGAFGMGGGGRKKKKNHNNNNNQQHQQQQQLQSEEDVQAAVGQMLRGIRGYIDANYGSSNDGHAASNRDGAAAARESSSMMTQFTNFDELGDATTTAPYYTTCGSAGTGAATNTTTTMKLPRDRYFTFRVEFTKPISKAQLPPALDDKSEEFGTVPALGKVLAGRDAVPNKLKAADDGDIDDDDDPAKQREPTADPKSLQRLGKWALGRVQPANGVSVGFHAFCEDPDDVGSLMVKGDDIGGSGRDILADDDDDTVSTEELGLRENADPQKIFAPISTKANDPSLESSQSTSIIAIGQSVLAYPHKGKNDMAGAVEQALSCTVVDTRVHNVHGQQYKVEFDGSYGLEHLKQWMSAERIVVFTSPICGSGGNEERKHKEADCSSTVEAAENEICRPKKRARVVYRYIAKPIRFKL